MFRDYTIVLWLVKLGGLINLYFLLNTSRLLASGDADAYFVLPAQILFAVSALRTPMSSAGSCFIATSRNTKTKE